MSVRASAVDRCRFQLPILKVRPGAVVRGVLGEVGPIWFGVHWVRERQLLCGASEDAGCIYCALGAARVVGLTLFETSIQGKRVEMLLEVSPLAFGEFEQRLRFGGFDLKSGVVVEVSRPRARSRLRIEPVMVPDRWQAWLDGERRLLNAWAVLYGMPLSSPTETFEEFLQRVRSVIEARARLAMPEVM